MNPKTLTSGHSSSRTGFRRGRNSRSNNCASKQSCHTRKRRTRDWVHKSVRLKESFGGIRAKKKLQCSLLNVNGLTASTLADVKEVLSRKQPDLCILIETKRRLESDELCIDVAGYDVSEYRRSDMAGDKGGGGLAIYTRNVDGLVFKNYDPDLPDPSHVFVRNERAWKTVESVREKLQFVQYMQGFKHPMTGMEFGMRICSLFCGRKLLLSAKMDSEWSFLVTLTVILAVLQELVCRVTIQM